MMGDTGRPVVLAGMVGVRPHHRAMGREVDLVQIRPRPSASHQWAGGGCTGSPAWRAKWLRESGSAAREGNRLHDVASRLLKSESFATTQSDIEAVRPYVQDVRAERLARPGSTLEIEKTLTWAEDLRYTGTPDAALYDFEAKHLIITDLKTGWGIVEPEMNWQLLSYAMMALSQQENESLWTVELRIVQPKAPHPRGPVRSWMPTLAERTAAFGTIRTKHREAMGTTAQLVTGEHCKYCDAFTVCPAARKLSMFIVEWANTTPHELPVNALAKELQTLRDAQNHIGNHISGLEASIGAMLSKGQVVPHVMQTHGGGTQKWKDETAAAAMLALCTGESQTAPKLPTPKQLVRSGVSRDLVTSLSETKPGKAKLVLDLDGAITKKMLGDELPDLSHTTGKTQ